MTRDTEKTIFAPDFQAFSLFRILFSVCLLGNFFINVLPYFDDLYGKGGLLVTSSLSPERGTPDLIRILLVLADSVGLASVFPFAYSLALLAFALGYRTRWANAAAFILNSYLFWRSPLANSHAELLARLLLFWCLFLPMNRYWSIDAALDPKPRDRPYPALPFVAIRLQISAVYVFSGLFKLAGIPWLKGYALNWALSDNVFGGTVTGLFLVREFSPLLFIVNYLVIGFQLTFPYLLYSPWRNDLTRAFAILCAALMHISFIFCLNIGAFPYLCLATLLLLVPDHWINKLLRGRRERLAPVSIYYEPGCGFCRRVSLILREFLLSPSSSVLPASADPKAWRLLTKHQSWVVRGADGKHYLKWRAAAYLLRQNIFLAPLGWLSDRRFLREPLDKFYDFIGRSRRRLGRIATVLLPIRSDRAIGPKITALCAGLVILAFSSNVAGVLRLYTKIPGQFDEVVAVLQVGQSWELFAPVPTHSRWDFRILVNLTDGSSLDLVERMSAPIFRSIDGGRNIDFVTHRWLKYFTRFEIFTDSDWSAFGRYLCRQAHELVPVPSAVAAVEVMSLTQSVANSSVEGGVTRRTLDCLTAQPRPVAKTPGSRPDDGDGAHSVAS